MIFLKRLLCLTAFLLVSAQDNPLLSKLRRRCLGDLNSWRKPEYAGDFFAYTNSTGSSEAECAQNCIERLEFCTSAMFIPEKNVCLYSYKVLHCEDGSRRTQVPFSPYFVLHCISCLGVVPSSDENVGRLGTEENRSGGPTFARPSNNAPGQHFLTDAGRSIFPGVKLTQYPQQTQLNGPPLANQNSGFQTFPNPRPPAWPTLPIPWPPSIKSFEPPGIEPNRGGFSDRTQFKEPSGGYYQETYGKPDWPRDNYVASVERTWTQPTPAGLDPREERYYDRETPIPRTEPPYSATEQYEYPTTPPPYYPASHKTLDPDPWDPNLWETPAPEYYTPPPRRIPPSPPRPLTPAPTTPSPIPYTREYPGEGYDQTYPSDPNPSPPPYTAPPRYFTTYGPRVTRRVYTLIPPPPRHLTPSPSPNLPATEESIWFPTVPPARISIYGPEPLERKFPGKSADRYPLPNIVSSKQDSRESPWERDTEDRAYPYLGTAVPPFDVDKEFPLELFTLRPPGTVLSYVPRNPPTTHRPLFTTPTPPILYERKPQVPDYKASPNSTFVHSRQSPSPPDYRTQTIPSLGAIPGPEPVTAKVKNPPFSESTPPPPPWIGGDGLSGTLGASFEEFWKALSKIGNNNVGSQHSKSENGNSPFSNPTETSLFFPLEPEKTRSPDYFNSLQDPRLRRKLDRLTKRIPNGVNDHLLHLSCPANLLKPCIFGFGMGCKLVAHEDGCRICSCPYKSPARGCSGPQGLNAAERLDLLYFRSKCPDGRMSQNVHRYSRMVDDSGFDDCVVSKQPYCGWLQDVNTWRMPRTQAECYYYCYSEEEREARNIVVRRTRRHRT